MAFLKKKTNTSNLIEEIEKDKARKRVIENAFAGKKSPSKYAQVIDVLGSAGDRTGDRAQRMSSGYGQAKRKRKSKKVDDPFNGFFS